jgi:hypothetical protein
VKLNNGLTDVFGGSLAVVSAEEVGTTRAELSATGRLCVTTGKTGAGRPPVCGIGVNVTAGEADSSLFNADVGNGALSAKIANNAAINSAASGGIQ